MSTSKFQFKCKILTAIAFVLSAVLLVGCMNENSEGEITRLTVPVPLVDSYSSLMTIEQVRIKLGITPNELENILKPALEKKQRTSASPLMRSWFEVSRENALLGFSGRVTFEFYYDRLARIVFFPRDIDEFLASALKVQMNSTQSGVVQTTTPSLRIAFGSNHVVWIDERIMAMLAKVD